MEESGNSINESPCDTAWGEIHEKNIVPSSFVPAPENENKIVIAIVGGGLVGLSLAIGLTRAGIKCTVYERAPQLRSVSQGILAIKPIGMQALRDIHPDIPKGVAEVGCERLRSVLTKVDSEGNVINTTNEHLGKDDMAKYGSKRVGITWHNMQQVLASLLPPGAVKTGRSLIRFVEEDDTVQIYFDGGEVVRCQVALMCDGVFSTARKQMFPEDKVINFGQLNWGSVVKTDMLPPDMHPPNAVRYCTYSGDPKWMAMINDGGGGHTFFQLRVSDPKQALVLSGSNGRGGLGLPGAIKRLSPLVQPCKDVSDVLASIPEEQIFERSIVGRQAAPTWLSPGQRVALVGDSAHGMHPNIGQGANTCFESAVVLIKSMVACNGNWASGLAAYEKDHKPRADIIQSFANIMGCAQSQQKELLSKDVISQILEWINTNDEINLPDDDVLSSIKQFNPLSQDGVSLIQ